VEHHFPTLTWLAEGKGVEDKVIRAWNNLDFMNFRFFGFYQVMHKRPFYIDKANTIP
jgi:hypothetical protein